MIVNECELRGESGSLKTDISTVNGREIYLNFIFIEANASLKENKKPVLLYIDPRNIVYALKLLLKSILNI